MQNISIDRKVLFEKRGLIKYIFYSQVQSMDIDNCNIHENGGDCLRDVMDCNWCHERVSFLCQSSQSGCNKHTDHTDQTVIILTLRILFEPWHEISNNVVCATSKGSDQPAHTLSLIRAFASRLHIL